MTPKIGVKAKAPLGIFSIKTVGKIALGGFLFATTDPQRAKCQGSEA
jgi:hypothetical protein